MKRLTIKEKQLNNACDKLIEKYRQTPAPNTVVYECFMAGVNEILRNLGKYGLQPIDGKEVEG